jgi:hypothetical protein
MLYMYGTFILMLLMILTLTVTVRNADGRNYEDDDINSKGIMLLI